MQVMDALGDPVRRRLVELLADGERSAGQLATAVGAEFGISQPAASRHLRVLREAGVVDSVPQGAVRLYSVRPEAFDEVEALGAPHPPVLGRAPGRVGDRDRPRAEEPR